MKDPSGALDVTYLRSTPGPGRCTQGSYPRLQRRPPGLPHRPTHGSTLDDGNPAATEATATRNSMAAVMYVATSPDRLASPQIKQPINLGVVEGTIRV
jgi:hypothetical protein